MCKTSAAQDVRCGKSCCYRPKTAHTSKRARRCGQLEGFRTALCTIDNDKQADIFTGSATCRRLPPPSWLRTASCSSIIVLHYLTELRQSVQATIMSQILAPYNNAMRLGQGFNSYTHQICLHDAVEAATADTHQSIETTTPGTSTTSSSMLPTPEDSDNSSDTPQIVTYYTRFVDKISDVVGW